MAAAAIARAASEDRPIERDAPAFPARVAADSQFFAEPTTNNLVEMTMTNYGFFGNNFNSTKASLVYPKGTTDAYEHMVRGGLWFGCQSQYGGLGVFPGVITATTDGFQGSSGNGATDYANSIARKENEDALADIKASGRTAIHELTEQQRQALKTAMLPTYNWAKGRVGTEVLALLNKAVDGKTN